MTWRLNDLRAKVSAKRAGNSLTDFDAAIESFVRRLNIASYHSLEAQQILPKALKSQEGAQFDTLMKNLIVSEPTEQTRDIRLAYFTTEAHTYAYAQAIHAASDILAKVVYYSLLLDMPNKHRGFVTLELMHDSRYIQSESLKRAISGVIKSSEYRYLSAFTNTIKHHSMIATAVPFQWFEETKEWVGLQLKPFCYKKERFEAKLVQEFVKDDFITVERGYLEIGCALNDAA